MPLSKTAQETKENFIKEYGKEKGEQNFYAYLNKNDLKDTENLKGKHVENENEKKDYDKDEVEKDNKEEMEKKDEKESMESESESKEMDEKPDYEKMYNELKDKMDGEKRSKMFDKHGIDEDSREYMSELLKGREDIDGDMERLKKMFGSKMEKEDIKEEKKEDKKPNYAPDMKSEKESEPSDDEKKANALKRLGIY